MIDLIIAQPMWSQGQLAEHFGYTQTWISRIFNSDAFQARLALRKEDLVDPSIIASIEEKFRAVASKSLDIVLDKLTLTNNADLALKSLEICNKAMGFGARDRAPVTNNFVVALPPKEATASAWVTAHSPHKALPATTEEVAYVDFQVTLPAGA
jgi:hypothetical protein